MRQQIKVKTGIDVPEYYNPGAINPIKYAEQQRKRNLLWSKEEKPEVEKPKVFTILLHIPQTYHKLVIH